MKDEKQIKEMARDIFEPRVAIDGIDIAFAAVHGVDDAESHFMRIARHLYKKGYRKSEAFSQPHENGGEWISVEDRKPTHKDGKVLIYTAYGISIAEITISGHWRGSCAIPKFITHWMPLPEPPKGE
jgi:hypothetical protein